MATLLCAAAWWGWRSPEPPTPRTVLVLARGDAEKDPFVQRFIKTWHERHADFGGQVRVKAMSLPSEPSAMATELQRLLAAQRPDVWVAQNGRQALTAHRAGSGIPLVFAVQADPVALGLVSSLSSRPEPSVGLWVNDELDAKRLELLLDAFPSVRQVGLIANAEWRDTAGERVASLHSMAAARGARLHVLIAETAEQAIAATQSTAFAQVQAWCLPRTLVTLDGQLGRHLVDRGLPTMSASASDVQTAAHLTYTFRPGLVEPTLADLVARVLRGEHPGAIPIQRPHRFQFAVRIARDPRLPPLNPDVVRRADVVVR